MVVWWRSGKKWTRIHQPQGKGESFSRYFSGQEEPAAIEERLELSQPLLLPPGHASQLSLLCLQRGAGNRSSGTVAMATLRQRIWRMQ